MIRKLIRSSFISSDELLLFMSLVKSKVWVGIRIGLQLQ